MDEDIDDSKTCKTHNQSVMSRSINDLSEIRKARRKTAYEIFFDEEPMFSDSEDEAKFEHQASLHIAKTCSLPGVSNHEESVPNHKLTNSVIDQVLNLCCLHCTCCKKIKKFLMLLTPPGLSPRYSSYSSYDGDFGPGRSHNPKIQKVANKDGNLSNKAKIISCQIFDPTNSLMEVSDQHDLRNRKSNSFKKDDNDQNILTETHRNKKDVIEKLKENVECDKKGTVRQLRKTRSNWRSRRRLSQKRNIEDAGDSSDIKSKYGLSSYKQIDGVITVKDLGESRRSSREPRPTKKCVSEYDPHHLKIRSSSEQNNSKKSDYHFVDKRFFKVPIDTTKNRSFSQAIVRKLGRTAGIYSNSESLNIADEGFRSFKMTQKLKKLYTSDEWLNSEDFLKLSG